MRSGGRTRPRGAQGTREGAGRVLSTQGNVRRQQRHRRPQSKRKTDREERARDWGRERALDRRYEASRPSPRRRGPRQGPSRRQRETGPQKVRRGRHPGRGGLPRRRTRRQKDRSARPRPRRRGRGGNRVRRVGEDILSARRRALAVWGPAAGASPPSRAGEQGVQGRRPGAAGGDVQRVYASRHGNWRELRGRRTHPPRSSRKSGQPRPPCTQRTGPRHPPSTRRWSGGASSRRCPRAPWRSSRLPSRSELDRPL